MPPIQVAWYWFCRNMIRFWWFMLPGGFRVVGKENVPRTGAIIVAPNHSSYLDPPAVGSALPRVLTYMAKEELFKFKFGGWLLRTVGAFPVRRGAGDIESIKLALKILERGDALLVFPEGTRDDGDHMLPINRGVEMLARKSGAPIVPTGVIGTSTKWGKNRKRKPWGKITVAFGKPVALSELGSGADFAVALEARILELCVANGYALKTASSNQPSNTAIETCEATESEPQPLGDTPAHP